MALITIEQAKEHLRITHSNEDVVLQMYIDAAEDSISNFLNQDSIPQKPAIKAAALLIIGSMYENREAHTEKDLKDNPAVSSLLFPYRIDMGM